MIIQNMAKCKKCGDEIFSKNKHDFVSCKCGSISVDGGMEYIRRVGNPENIEDMSYSLKDEIVTEMKDAITWSRDNNRNDLGIVLAICRVLKKHNRLITNEILEN